MIKRILVCMKAVPVSASVPIDSEFRLKREGVGLEWNPADLSALEAALLLKEKDGEVAVLTMGPVKIAPLLQDLFARGVDRAILATDRKMVGSDTKATAYVLKMAAEKIGLFDLILCGRRAIDGETGQVAAELAAALDMPSVSNVEKLERQGDTLVLYRRLEDGTRELFCKEPLVVSVCEYSYRLRLPGILAMRKAKSKTVEQLSAEDLKLEDEVCGMKGSLTRVIAMEQNFPGMRNGQKETDLNAGVVAASSMIRKAMR